MLSDTPAFLASSPLKYTSSMEKYGVTWAAARRGPTALPLISDIPPDW